MLFLTVLFDEVTPPLLQDKSYLSNLSNLKHHLNHIDLGGVLITFHAKIWY